MESDLRRSRDGSARGVPLVLIDMYEHAFYVDYKNKKGDYINNFVKYFDWNEINLR